MKEILFLTLAEVLDIHRELIEEFGGSPGLRDLGLLESALALPAAGFDATYFHEDIFAMAAAYLFHLCRNHPFLDGNKRTAALAAYAFLGLNGLDLTASPAAYYNLVMRVAEGKSGKDKISAFFRKYCRGL
ncbi:MAG: type II toxin-antitoxin system death-on-curing family toxin [Candidatus Wallbacteria bacterium]|nr:type II toxin-antitoxin system death-on-curing family toxin [Candidatus Wallbacteria bacterium]